VSPHGPRPTAVWTTACKTRGPRPYRCFASWAGYGASGRYHTTRIGAADYEAWLADGVPYLARKFDEWGTPLPRPDRARAEEGNGDE